MSRSVSCPSMVHNDDDGDNDDEDEDDDDDESDDIMGILCDGEGA